MITVLQFVHKYRGDYELFNLQANLDRQRFRMIICYLSGVPDGRDRMVGIADKVLYLQCRPDRLYWYNLPLLLKLKRIIDEERAQVVNCQQHRTTPLGVLARLLSRSKPVLVATLHGLGTARSWQRRLSNWLLYRWFYRIVGISAGVSADIVASNWRLSPRQVVTIQNGLDYEPFVADLDQRSSRSAILPGKEGAFWFGTAGRLSKVKNQHTLIEAFAIVAERVPESILVLAGKGELEGELKARVDDLGLQGRVFFLGFRRDIPCLLNALDVFLLPSLREGLPLALLEAMASSRPVIASSVGGIPEVVGDGAFARLVDPLDVASLANAMCAFESLPEAGRLALGAQARDRAVNSFNAGRMASGYAALYADAHDLWLKQHGEN
jgi:glycosyltransferase involved in cell wall biosynthesis